MSDNDNFGFARLVPGFDFLQNLAKGASQSIPQMPNLSSWVAPTLNVEELDKRIAELKAVQFWLEQNGRALGATIQALEVQKMTLATLQGMNFSMGELANALKVKTTEVMEGGMRRAGEAAEAAAGVVSAAADAASGASAGERKDAGARKAAGRKADEKADEKKSGNGAAPVDPLQWWGALTQQFQQIAANAMKDALPKADGARASGEAKGSTAKGASSSTGAAAKKAPRKAPARKAAAKKPTS